MLYLIGQDIKRNAGSKGVAGNGHAPLEVRVTLAEEVIKTVHLSHYLIDNGLRGKQRTAVVQRQWKAESDSLLSLKSKPLAHPPHTCTCLHWIPPPHTSPYPHSPTRKHPHSLTRKHPHSPTSRGPTYVPPNDTPPHLAVHWTGVVEYVQQPVIGELPQPSDALECDRLQPSADETQCQREGVNW